MTSKLNVLTYNIASGIDAHGRFNMGNIAETIKNTKAGIIGLQEVDVHWDQRSTYINEVQFLEEKLNMLAYCAPIYVQKSLDQEEARKFGLLVLSKYPIVKAINHKMTRLSTQEVEPQRELRPGFPEVIINVNGIEILFFVAHLDYRTDPTIREIQVGEILDIISPDRSNVILVGDFNAEPDDVELQPLFKRFQDLGDSVNQLIGNTFPVPEPTKRIDYILTSHDFQILNTEVMKSNASDHYPVVATLETAGKIGESTRMN